MAFTPIRLKPALLSVLFPALAFALEAGGTIEGDTTWSLRASPLHIDGVLTVEPGCRLTIEPLSLIHI